MHRKPNITDPLFRLQKAGSLFFGKLKFKREELSKYLLLFAPKAAHDRVLLQKKSFESAIKNDFFVKGKNYFGFYKVPRNQC